MHQVPEAPHVKRRVEMSQKTPSKIEPLLPSFSGYFTSFVGGLLPGKSNTVPACRFSLSREQSPRMLTTVHRCNRRFSAAPHDRVARGYVRPLPERLVARQYHRPRETARAVSSRPRS